MVPILRTELRGMSYESTLRDQKEGACFANLQALKTFRIFPEYSRRHH